MAEIDVFVTLHRLLNKLVPRELIQQFPGIIDLEFDFDFPAFHRHKRSTPQIQFVLALWTNPMAFYHKAIGR